MAGVNSLYWDALTLEVVGPLVSGGTVALMEEEYLLPEGLAALVRDHGVDTAWLSSSLFNMFVDEDLSCFDGMSQLLIGGERVSQHHIRKFLTRHPSVRLINGYGPAEACVFATTHPVTLADTDHPDGIPIGRVVPQTAVHLLDGDARCRPGRPVRSASPAQVWPTSTWASRWRPPRASSRSSWTVRPPASTGRVTWASRRPTGSCTTGGGPTAR